jgi:transposase InsO family protein
VRRQCAAEAQPASVPPASPWPNGFAERLIGSIRRECVDYFIVLVAHLRRILRTYARYYNNIRTHRHWIRMRRFLVPFIGSGL